MAMKKIVVGLLAVAALASCGKETAPVSTPTTTTVTVTPTHTPTLEENVRADLERYGYVVNDWSRWKNVAYQTCALSNASLVVLGLDADRDPAVKAGLYVAVKWFCPERMDLIGSAPSLTSKNV